MILKSSSAPYLRGKKTTLQIMIELCIGLTCVWLFGIIYSFVEGGLYYGFKAILNMIVALVVTCLCDVCTALVRHKPGASRKEEILHLLSHNYSFISAIILVLTLPVWTPYYVIILGSVFATVVVKNFFGGFGKNIFNPAALARIFVVICFQGKISSSSSGFEALTSGTVTGLINQTSHWVGNNGLILPSQYSLQSLFLGTYFGALGETSTLLILVVGIILAFRQDLNWRIPSFYLGTVCLSSLFVGLCLGFNNPFEYMLIHLSSGGLVFGAVFMLTDPITAPTSNFGKALVGVFAGLITILIRFSFTSSYPEGVVFAIALSNIISPVIDHYTTGKSSSKLGLKYGLVFGGVILTMVLGLLVANNSTIKMNEQLNNTSIVEYDNENIILPYEIKEVK